MTGTPASYDVLRTERLTLRPPRPADEAAFVAYYVSDYRAAHARRLTPDEAEQRFRDLIFGHWDRKGYGRFIVEETGDDTPLGLVGPHFPDDYPEPEIAWQLWTPGDQGKGLAYEAALAARTHAYDTLGWTGAVSYIRADNTRSQALAHRLGAVREEGAPYPPSIGPHDLYRHPGPEAAR